MNAAPVVLLRVDRARAESGHPRHRHPALDLKYVEAALAQHHGIACALVDGWLLADGPPAWIAAVLQHTPQIVVIKAASWCLNEATYCAEELKRRGIATLAIGQQAEHRLRLPDATWQRAFDAALLGEVESELPKFLAAWLAHPQERAALLAQRAADFQGGVRHGISAADALPPPRFSDAELAAYPFPFPLPGPPLRRWGYVLTAWGCPHGCLHCTAIVRKSTQRGLQKRSPARVVDEIAAYLERGVDAIAFEDDTLLADRRHALALCEEISRRGLRLRWLANARPDELDDELIAALAASGASCLKIGVETAVPRLIEGLGKTRDGAAWAEQCAAGFAALRRHRIASVALFMVGLPDETADDVERSIALARRLAPDYVQVQQFMPYPDIALWTPASVDANQDLYHYADSPATAALQQHFYRRFYLRPGFLVRHLLNYGHHYLDTMARRPLRETLGFFRRSPLPARNAAPPARG
jgi:radical SAM superfamily enzyme YgiQ (UPF0313 family)